jgi:hypothetical protein
VPSRDVPFEEKKTEEHESNSSHACMLFLYELIPISLLEWRTLLLHHQPSHTWCRLERVDPLKDSLTPSFSYMSFCRVLNKN